MRLIHLLLFILFVPLFGNCQPLTVKGTVLDEEGRAIAGATIRIGEQEGNKYRPFTTSDGKGNFQLVYDIPVRTDSRLLEMDSVFISATGYLRKIVPVNQFISAAPTIVLQRDYKALGSVTVSTGYQDLPKERATGSFSKIDDALLNQQISPSVLSRLEAIGNSIAVDRITTSPGKLQVRGRSTISGPSDVLIVLDNFPYEGDISSINPNDVESITLLKDAAASSIWGARAGNGVIVITTKKAKKETRPVIEFNNNILVTARPDLFYRPQLSPADYVSIEQFLFNHNYRLADTAAIDHPALTPVYEVLLKQKYGQISPQQAAAALDGFRSHDLRNDFNTYIHQPALHTQHYISLRAGSSQLAWQFSAGYDKDVNEVQAKSDRFTLRMHNSFKPGKRFTVNTNIYSIWNWSTSGKQSYDGLSSLSGLVPLYSSLVDENGNPLPLIKEYRLPWLDTVGGGRLMNWQYYPLTDRDHSITSANGHELLFAPSVSYQFVPWLSASVNYQYQLQSSHSFTNNGIESYYTRDLINTFTQLGATATADKYIIPRGGIRDDLASANITHSVRSQLTIAKNSALHGINAIAGAELRSVNSTTRTNRVYGYDPFTLSSVPVDLSNGYPSFVTGSLSFIPNGQSFSSGTYRYVSLFANATYSYQNRYHFSLSGRRDASNLFGVATNDKWQPLWSAGAAWDIDKEKFFTPALFSSLRWRLTYGASGNLDLSKAAISTIGYRSPNPFTQTPVAVIDRIANPQLQWEQVKQLNTGIDFRIAGERVKGSLEYYHKNAEQLFGRAPVDPTAGVGSSIVKNVASMKANGIDADLEFIVVEKPFRWTVQLNYSYFKDKVTDYYLSSLKGSNFISTGQPGISGLTGKPVYSIFSYRWAGLDPLTGDPLGIITGNPSKDYAALTGAATTIDQLTYHGPALPVHFGSFGSGFHWKNFDLSFRFQYKLGYYFRRSTISYENLYNLRLGHPDYLLRWQKPGDESVTDVPSMVFPSNTNRDVFYTGSSVLIEKGDHIRLRYISISYELRKEAWKAMPLKMAQLYITADNVGIIWRANKRGIDPDAPFALLPPSRSIAAGIRIQL